MRWMTSGHELRDQDTSNNLGVLLKGMILGRELKALDGMNNLGLQMIWVALDR